MHRVGSSWASPLLLARAGLLDHVLALALGTSTLKATGVDVLAFGAWDTVEQTGATRDP